MFHKRIESKENKFIKKYKKAVSSKKTRTAEFIFAAEGKRLVTDAIKNNIEPEYVFLSESEAEKCGSEFENLGVDYYIISQKLADEIAETSTTQGVFGLFKKPKIYNIDDILKNGKKFLVLVSLQDPGNMGTVLRTADAFGIDGIITSGCCEIFSPKVVRSAMGAVFRAKTVEYSNATELPGILKKYNIKTYASVLQKDSFMANEIDFGGKTAVFIGNEGNGLPENIYNLCDKKVILPMLGKAESLNAAIAAGIFMWEMEKSSIKEEI